MRVSLHVGVTACGQCWHRSAFWRAWRGSPERPHTPLCGDVTTAQVLRHADLGSRLTSTASSCVASAKYLPSLGPRGKTRDKEWCSSSRAPWEGADRTGPAVPRVGHGADLCARLPSVLVQLGSEVMAGSASQLLGCGDFPGARGDCLSRADGFFTVSSAGHFAPQGRARSCQEELVPQNCPSRNPPRTLLLPGSPPPHPGPRAPHNGPGLVPLRKANY